MLSRGQEAALAMAWVPQGWSLQQRSKGRTKQGGQSQCSLKLLWQSRWVPCAPSVRGGGGGQCSSHAQSLRLANVLTPVLLLAGFARSHPDHCYDLAASEGCGQHGCLQGFERLLLAFLFRVSTEIRDILFFASSFLALWGSEVSEFFCSQLKRLKPY